jgi:hypothetical protein
VTVIDASLLKRPKLVREHVVALPFYKTTD